MRIRPAALIFAVLFLITGVGAFIPGLVTPETGHHPGLVPHGRFLGLFPTNTLHNALHIGFGIWGVLAWRTAGAARFYLGAIAMGYLLLAAMGLSRTFSTFFGYMPLYGHDVWLHAILAIAATACLILADRRSEGRPAGAHL
jgi:hypothetical protein